MSEKEELDLHRNAKDLINQISVVVRTAQIHDTNNVATASAISKLVSMINILLGKENFIALELRGEFFYINDYRIRYSLEYLLNFDFLVREFKKRELGSVIFKHQLKVDDVKIFTKAFISSPFSEEPFIVFQEQMSDVQSIEVARLKKIVEDEESLDVRKMIKKSYFNAVSYTKGVINKIKTGEKVNIKKAKRVMESMVDHILEEEQLLLGMTAIKDYDEYTYHHSVNVSILSIALGQRLGLSRKLLTDLGMVALFHDTGKTEVPNEVLNKPTNFTDDEWKIIRKHPIWGLKAILKLMKLDELSMKSAIVSFEHHMNVDYSGYPKARQKMELDLFSRIVSLADQYDAMTSSRVYSRTPMAPDKALSIMMERSGTQLDPLLFKFFINMVGVYPIGTLVMLDSRELGLVTESNQIFPTRPRVLLIIDSKGNRIEGHIVDLAEKNEQDNYIRSIIRTLDPNKYKINLAEYLL
ncbi:MAG: HD-GYP domain-containing protein [Nitrospiraceae bacterium]|nr:MAG: HD-GYP domain-containing protein [Nitrospiraceae bacterium]